MRLEFTGGDVKPGRNGSTGCQHLVIGRDVDQIVLDAGPKGFKRILTVSSERRCGEDEARTSRSCNALKDTGELLGSGLVPLVNQGNAPSPAELVDAAEEFFVVELIDE